LWNKIFLFFKEAPQMLMATTIGNISKNVILASNWLSLKVWLIFLTDYNGVTVMLDNLWSSNETIEFYADSAGGSNRGFGIYFQGKWAQACWPKDWIDNQLTQCPEKLKVTSR
jgi:hypothetical protein